MSKPRHDSRQILIRRIFGIPILMVRTAKPGSFGQWKWGRWRLSRLAEDVTINAMLMETWK